MACNGAKTAYMRSCNTNACPAVRTSPPLRLQTRPHAHKKRGGPIISPKGITQREPNAVQAPAFSRLLTDLAVAQHSHLSPTFRSLRTGIHTDLAVANASIHTIRITPTSRSLTRYAVRHSPTQARRPRRANKHSKRSNS